MRRLLESRMSHSGWRYAEVVAGETFLALKQGLQNALWELGGVPQVIRSDNTSALTHEMKRSRGRALNDAYGELLDHYGLRSATFPVAPVGTVPLANTGRGCGGWRRRRLHRDTTGLVDIARSLAPLELRVRSAAER